METGLVCFCSARTAPLCYEMVESDSEWKVLLRLTSEGGGSLQTSAAGSTVVHCAPKRSRLVRARWSFVNKTARLPLRPELIRDGRAQRLRLIRARRRPNARPHACPRVRQSATAGFESESPMARNAPPLRRTQDVPQRHLPPSRSAGRSHGSASAGEEVLAFVWSAANKPRALSAASWD